MDKKELFKRYKKMKSLSQICKENGLNSANIDREKKATKENQEIVEKEIIREVTKMYNYIVFGGEI